MSWFYFFHSRLWPCNCAYPISMFEGLIIGVPELTFALPSSYLGCLMDFLGLGWHKMTSRPNVSSLPDDRASEPSCHHEPRTYIMFKKVYYNLLNYTQCPSIDLIKRFLPRPKSIAAWKLITNRSKISKNWNPPNWVPLHRFFKNWFLLIQKQLYSNYIPTHFTK